MVEAVGWELQERDEAVRQLKYNLEKAQEQMKKYANMHRQMQEFQVGVWVFLKLIPHRR